MKTIKPCDDYCPATHSMNAIYYENLGCLPGPYDIHQLLQNKQVWMCHNNKNKPCAATKLTTIPPDHTPIIEW